MAYRRSSRYSRRGRKSYSRRGRSRRRGGLTQGIRAGFRM